MRKTYLPYIAFSNNRFQGRPVQVTVPEHSLEDHRRPGTSCAGSFLFLSGDEVTTSGATSGMGGILTFVTTPRLSLASYNMAKDRLNTLYQWPYKVLSSGDKLVLQRRSRLPSIQCGGVPDSRIPQSHRAGIRFQC
jgi:hypothetical protein